MKELFIFCAKTDIKNTLNKLNAARDMQALSESAMYLP